MRHINKLLWPALLFLVSLAVFPVYAVEKPVACPTEFNPDDSVWALVAINESLANAPVIRVVLAMRLLTYFPNHEYRVLTSPPLNGVCNAALYSFRGPRGGEKRAWGFIHDHEKISHYLLTENGWEAGDKVLMFSDCDSAKDCNLVFTLYKKGAPVASQILEIKD